jgi:hypothetical protein
MMNRVLADFMSGKATLESDEVTFACGEVYHYPVHGLVAPQDKCPDCGAVKVEQRHIVEEFTL